MAVQIDNFNYQFVQPFSFDWSFIKIFKRILEIKKVGKIPLFTVKPILSPIGLVIN